MTPTASAISPFVNEPLLDFRDPTNAARQREAIERVRA
jgi:hypothetical protein